MRRFLPLLACLPASAWAGDAPGELPDGLYVCSFFSLGMINIVGDMEIEGAAYRGPSFDKAWDGTYPYLVQPDGSIEWGGPLGGYVEPDFRIARSSVAEDGEGFGFTVAMQPDDFEIDISCSPQ